MFHKQKIDSCYIKSSTKIWQRNFLGKKLIHVCLRFKLVKIFKAVPKINPKAHSPQQNKKAVLTTAVYFKVSTLVRSQRQ